MGLKHKKYVYVRLEKDKYIKVRVLKNKADNLPEKYVVVGPSVKKPPVTAVTLDITDLPKEVADRILSDYYEVAIK